MQTVIIFLIVLAILIFVHELGHFLFARACGIRVDEFKIGFGPKIFAWKKGETQYGLNLIPFGGYVKIFGENPDEESTTGSDSKRSFVNQNRWKQALVLVAGILFNFIFAWILYVIVFCTGVTATTDSFAQYSDRFQNERIMVTGISANSPADKAGIVTGDVIKSIVASSTAGANVSKQTIADIQKVTNSSSSVPVTVDIVRGGILKEFKVVPTAGIVPGKFGIGVAMSDVVDFHLSFFYSIIGGFRYTGIMIKETVVGLYTFIANIFQGTANFADVAGPVGIAGIVGDAAHLGFRYLVTIMALISINLGVINLIPFPALDGGRILFVGIEGAIRRRIDSKFFNIVNTVGFVLLMILMVVVTYKDIAKLIK